METYRFLVTKIVYYKPTSWYIYIHCNQAETSFFSCNTAITVIIGRHFGVSFNSTFTEICLPMIWFLWIKTWVGGRKRFLCYFTIEPMNFYGCVEINQQHVKIRKYLKDSKSMALENPKTGSQTTGLQRMGMHYNVLECRHLVISVFCRHLIVNPVLWWRWWWRQ